MNGNGKNSGKKENAFLQICEQIFNRLKHKGVIKRIIEYDPILEEEDIKHELICDLYKKAKQYKPGYGTSLGAYLSECCFETITKLIKRGSRNGYVVREVGDVRITDERYSLYRARNKHLKLKSKRLLTKVEEMIPEDDNNKRSFYETYYIESSLTKTPEEILIEREEIQEHFQTSTDIIAEITSLITELESKIYGSINKKNI